MTAMIPPVAAAKGAGKAANALTGDLYIKRWQSVQGKGKKKKVVDHELHINPLTLAIGAGAAAAGALFLGIGLWMTQKKVTSTAGKDRYYRLRMYPATDKREAMVVVFTKHGAPIKRVYPSQLGGQALGLACISKAEVAAGYRNVEKISEVDGKDSLGEYTEQLVRYHTDSKKSYGLGDREGFSMGGLL